MPSAYQIHGRTQYPWTSLDALQNLRLNTDVPKPTDIPKGHALVRIRAAALNARDMMVIAHDPVYPGPHAPDLVPCADSAGEIDAVGQDSPWKVGDRVVVNSNSWMDWKYSEDDYTVDYYSVKGKGAGDVQGTLREYAIVPDEELIKAPAHLSFEDLAAMPSAGGTAIHALFRGPKALKPGQTVLAQGTGGVSCFVIQIAAAIGATVIATSSSDAKLEKARELGATHLINYRTHPNWSDEVRRLTNGKGVDVVVDVAGAGTIKQSLKSTKVGGVVSLVGFLSGEEKTDIVMDMIYNASTVYGVLMYTKEMTDEVYRIFEKKGIRPAVSKVFEWEDAKAAFELLSTGGGVGKVVIKVGA